MRRTLAAALLGTSARFALRASAAPGEEGAPAAPAPEEQPAGETPPAAPAGVQTPPPAAPAPAEEQPAADRPKEWPEGVDSWEAFGKLTPEERAKAYTPAEPAPAPEPGSVEAVVEDSLKGMAPEMAAKARPFVEAFAKTGTLTDQQVTDAASAMGLSEAMVRQYMANGQAEAQENSSPAYELVGGADNWGGFQSWANEALGPQDHAKINAALGINEKGVVVGGIDSAALKEYTEAYMASGRGPAPRDVTTEAQFLASQSADTDVFASAAEMSKAINDPKYRTNEGGYRDKVMAKIGRSNL